MLHVVLDVLVCLRAATCTSMLCSLLHLTSKARTARDVIKYHGFQSSATCAQCLSGNECCLLCGAVALAHTLQIGADRGKTEDMNTWRLSSVSTKIHEDVHILRSLKVYLLWGIVKITSLSVPFVYCLTRYFVALCRKTYITGACNGWKKHL